MKFEPMDFYPESVDADLFDALCWALDMEPSPCRCMSSNITGGEPAYCRAHQALKQAEERGVMSRYGRAPSYPE